MQLRKQPLVGHITSNDDAIHLLLAEVLERMDERPVGVCATKMYVADNANDEVRLTKGGNLFSKARRAKIGSTGEGCGALKKFSAIHSKGELVVNYAGKKGE